MRFLHQYLAFHLFKETVFERAGDYLVRGRVDPRLLVRLFPEYQGKLIGTAEEVEVFDGLKPILAGMSTVKTISTWTKSDIIDISLRVPRSQLPST